MVDHLLRQGWYDRAGAIELVLLLGDKEFFLDTVILTSLIIV